MPILCKATRGFYVESIHMAYAVVVDGDGKIVFSSGDPEYLTCIRSSCKPFQASASIKAGAVEAAGFTSSEIALMCASHSGQDIHVETAKAMMKKIGYGVEHFECGAHMPYYKPAADYLIRNNLEPQAWHNNCSGKHAGMLSLAKHLGVDPKHYSYPDHPVQKTVFNQLEALSGVTDMPIGIDGCSLPVPFLSLYTIARMFQKLGGGAYPELNVAFDAMSANPMLIGGTGRFDTDFITVMKGRAITKAGGESVRGVTIRLADGETLGIAIKVLDGNQRANPVATLAVLEHLDLLTDAELQRLEDYRSTKLYNHRGIHTGNISARIEE